VTLVLVVRRPRTSTNPRPPRAPITITTAARSPQPPGSPLSAPQSRSALSPVPFALNTTASASVMHRTASDYTLRSSSRRESRSYSGIAVIDFDKHLPHDADYEYSQSVNEEPSAPMSPTRRASKLRSSRSSSWSKEEGILLLNAMMY